MKPEAASLPSQSLSIQRSTDGASRYFASGKVGATAQAPTKIRRVTFLGEDHPNRTEGGLR
ncbi:uncharacterized protein MEPE_06830 [Melanopsichium pennsylvanicum]|uniref:Uncharacterized protein n=1 Tax=Melanopsichium pennsylvanicum TaxID=63383 RepID=A0AAJ4XRV2_9BASI|nr:uncharacterized protein MEPE_06830 [Melanopsichium pennsylvanicum]